MSIKKAMATGLFLEKRKEETLEFLANNIATSFELLANTDPNVALSVLQQMNEQFDEDKAEELATSLHEQIDNIAQKFNLTADDLEED